MNSTPFVWRRLLTALLPVADRGMGWMTTPVALPFVGVQPRAASRQVFAGEPMTSPPVRVVPYPKALLARVARDDADDGGPIVGVGAVGIVNLLSGCLGLAQCAILGP